jgi:cytochrome c-type biogenesis protein CcmE
MVDGVLLEDGTVRADRVLAKCPSRYKRRVTPR